MSDVEKFDLFRESCELDDRIRGHESELMQIEGHVRWLRRQIEILKEKRETINASLAAEAKRGKKKIDKAIDIKLGDKG